MEKSFIRTAPATAREIHTILLGMCLGMFRKGVPLYFTLARDSVRQYIAPYASHAKFVEELNAEALSYKENEFYREMDPLKVYDCYMRSKPLSDRTHDPLSKFRLLWYLADIQPNKRRICIDATYKLKRKVKLKQGLCTLLLNSLATVKEG